MNNRISAKLKPASPQIRIFAADKITMETLAEQQNESLPTVFHRILAERPRLLKENVNYLKRLSERSGKSIWDIIDEIIFEHQREELGRQIARKQHGRSDDQDQLDTELNKLRRDMLSDLEER
jgi:hypothetical protein